MVPSFGDERCVWLMFVQPVRIFPLITTLNAIAKGSYPSRLVDA
jgi:hypothetical protein